jgi:hypothetical protein
MPAALSVPMGTLTSLGVGKETVFAAFTTPTIWHSLKSFSPKSTNMTIPRTGARKRWGQSEPITGGYDFSAALAVESDPDAIGQLWAYAMGSQGAPTHNIVATTVGTGGSTLGSTNIPVTSIAGIQVGCSLTVDTAANQETVVVADVLAGAITTASVTTHAHTAGVVVTLTSATAYLSYLKMGTLPSFSIELDAQTDVLQYTGLFIDSWAINMGAAAEVEATFNIVGALEDIKGSAATTPVYSILKPLSSVDVRSNVLIANIASGAIGQVGVTKISFSCANNLKKGYYSIGTGRRVLNYPQLQRKVTGTLELGFETDAAYRSFLGASGATSPQSDVPGVQINAQVVSPATVDSVLNLAYALNVIIANAKFTGYSMKIVSNDMIVATVTFESSESANGADDDLSMYLTSAASAVY